MRNAFASSLVEYAQNDPKVVLLSGDIGNRLFDRYKQAFPKQFYNCGVAESNMISVAAGLALSGLKPIAYTISTFNLFRPYEQIRLDVCYHNLPVVLVGVGGGFSYGSLGGSHHCIEDIALMRTLPNMQVVCPADPLEVQALLPKLLDQNHPVYMRMGKKGEQELNTPIANCSWGSGMILTEGPDALLLSTGTILKEVLDAQKQLKEEGIDVTVAHFPWVKPLDTHLLNQLFTSFPTAIVCEEHLLASGFSSAITEHLQDSNQSIKLIRMGIKDRFSSPIGSRNFLLKQNQLDKDAIVNNVKHQLEVKTL